MRLGEIGDGRPGVRRVAVIGAGIAGLSSAWLLARDRQNFEVTVYEAGAYAGGHTNTVEVTVDGEDISVDTGFLVFNRHTYPNLCALFEMLDVSIVESEMSFAVSLETPLLEWAGSDLGTVFAQRVNLFRPAVWRMLADTLRFNRNATRMALEGEQSGVTLGEYLDAEGYSAPFRDWYLLPMAAAIWSCPTGTMLSYPLTTFVRFCHNHGLLQVSNRPKWLTVRGGGKNYVRKMLESLPDVRLNTPVQRVVPDGDGVWVQGPRGVERYDDVILACHSDQALALLGHAAHPTVERSLRSVRYQPNRAILHTDAALLPRRKKVWSAWNYLAGSAGADQRPVSVSYLINRLQPIDVETPVVVSLNPFKEPDPAKVLGSFEYAHPVFDRAAIDAQGDLDKMQGLKGLWYAGAWMGFGFHEDGLKSAMSVVERMGVTAPWCEDKNLQRVPA